MDTTHEYKFVRLAAYWGSAWFGVHDKRGAPTRVMDSGLGRAESGDGPPLCAAVG